MVHIVMAGDTPKVKKWVLSPHAAMRAEERNISLQSIESIVQQPDDVVSQGPKFVFVKNFPERDDNDLAAVLIEKQSEDVWVIITVMTNFEIR